MARLAFKVQVLTQAYVPEKNIPRVLLTLETPIRSQKLRRDWGCSRAGADRRVWASGVIPTADDASYKQAAQLPFAHSV
jgi:hypothetical protein